MNMTGVKLTPESQAAIRRQLNGRVVSTLEIVKFCVSSHQQIAYTACQLVRAKNLNMVDYEGFYFDKNFETQSHFFLDSELMISLVSNLTFLDRHSLLTRFENEEIISDTSRT